MYPALDASEYNLKPQIESLPIVPLWHLFYEYILLVLIRNNCNRTYTAKALKIPLRTLRCYLNVMRHYNYDVPPPKRKVLPIPSVTKF